MHAGVWCFALPAIICCCACRTSEPPAASATEQSSETARQAKIVTALERLALQEPTSFATFSDPITEKFVSFLRHPPDNTLLDLPEKALTIDERNRAEDWAKRHGVKLNELRASTADRQPRVIRTYQLDIGNNAERGATLACEIFEEVYQLPVDFTLHVDEYHATTIGDDE